MKEVTRVHTCVLHFSVMQWLIANAKPKGDENPASIEFMPMPPPDRLVRATTLVPAHPLADGSIMTKIEVVTLEDEA